MKIIKDFVRLGCLSALFAFFASGCSDSGSTGPSAGHKGGRIQLVPAINGKQGVGKLGSSGSAGLESFQVAVSQIQLAKSLNTNGSGWSDISGTLPLFSQDLGDFNAVDTAQARSLAWNAHYIDFCSHTSIERISSSQPFTLRDTGDYHWAVINWAPFFRIRATVPLPGNDTVYTHDGPIVSHFFPNSAVPYYVTESSQSLLQGPSEDALVRKNNGGTWFRFLKPLRLTEADLDTGMMVADTVGRDSLGQPIIHHIASGKWNVLLVFNPRDFNYAGTQDSGDMGINTDILSPAGSAYLHVPFLKATAVPYRDGEDVMRETYEFSVNGEFAGTQGTYGMRLELYLIGDNLVAATMTSYPTDGNLAPPEAPTIFFADTKGDGSLSLQNYDRSPIFDGFQRMTSVGGEGTVAWDPGVSGQNAQTLSYHLVESRKAN